jgi:hypothetical protein
MCSLGRDALRGDASITQKSDACSPRNRCNYWPLVRLRGCASGFIYFEVCSGAIGGEIMVLVSVRSLRVDRSLADGFNYLVGRIGR